MLKRTKSLKACHNSIYQLMTVEWKKKKMDKMTKCNTDAGHSSGSTSM